MPPYTKLHLLACSARFLPPHLPNMKRSPSLFLPPHETSYLELCRNFYGSYVKTIPAHTTGSVIRAVATEEAVLGIAPLPKQDDSYRWWPSYYQAKHVHRVLWHDSPFTGLEKSREGGELEALVISCHTRSFDDDPLASDSRSTSCPHKRRDIRRHQPRKPRRTLYESRLTRLGNAGLRRSGYRVAHSSY